MQKALVMFAFFAIFLLVAMPVAQAGVLGKVGAFAKSRPLCFAGGGLLMGAALIWAAVFIMASGGTGGGASTGGLSNGCATPNCVDSCMSAGGDFNDCMDACE